MNLLIKYYNEAKRAIYLSNEENETTRSKREEITRFFNPEDRLLSMKSMGVKSKSRGSGRCCICFDPFPIQNLSIVVFFCCHAYHTNCLTDSIQSFGSKKKQVKKTKSKGDEVSYYEYDNGDADEDDEEEEEGGDAPTGSQMRCILCTTAAVS